MKYAFIRSTRRSTGHMAALAIIMYHGGVDGIHGVEDNRRAHQVDHAKEVGLVGARSEPSDAAEAFGVHEKGSDCRAADPRVEGHGRGSDPHAASV